MDARAGREVLGEADACAGAAALAAAVGAAGQSGRRARQDDLAGRADAGIPRRQAGAGDARQQSYLSAPQRAPNVNLLWSPECEPAVPTRAEYRRTFDLRQQMARGAGRATCSRRSQPVSRRRMPAASPPGCAECLP